MTAVRVLFRECIQDSQEYGSDDEHMVSRVFFDLEVDGRVTNGLYVDIKQAAGGNFEKDPIEVSPPRGARYNGPFNYQSFRDEVEKYFRELVGAKGRHIQIVDSTNIRIYNARHRRPKTVEFDADVQDAGW